MLYHIVITYFLYDILIMNYMLSVSLGTSSSCSRHGTRVRARRVSTLPEPTAAGLRSSSASPSGVEVVDEVKDLKKATRKIKVI